MAAVALIFDLDGTIWDSAGWFASGLKDDPNEAHALRLDLIAGGNVVAALRQAGISRSKMLRRSLERCGPPPIFDGMAEALADLSSRGVPLGIATSLPGTIAVPMLSAAGLYDLFDAVVHAGICRSPKPNPTSLNMALKMLELPASQSIYYVGDRATDASAAANAGLNFAWMRHGYEMPGARQLIETIEPRKLAQL